MNQRIRGASGLTLLLTLTLLATPFTTPSVAHAQAEPGTLLVVSKPPPPTVPSDPRQGLVFSAPFNMAASSITFDLSAVAEATGVPKGLEYLRLDAAGDAYITFSGGPEASPGGVMVVEDFLDRETFDPARDRLITGEATGLVSPKDLVVVGNAGVIIVADFAEAQVATFDTEARGSAAPRFVTTALGTTEAGEPRRPWGLAFDAATDRLFIGGTDGKVLVFDDYLARRGEGGPSRIITPTLEGQQASANVHDLVYLKDEDVLIATDVGAATTADQPGFDTDGKVFLLGNASAASGDTEVEVQLAGPSTLLGNPVGAASDGIDLFITEKARDTVLRFSGVLELSGAVDAAPTGAVTVAKPEAVALVSGGAD